MNYDDLNLYEYELPPELIAQHPTADRSASRMLLCQGGHLADKSFSDITSILDENCFLVMNDSKVLAARMPAMRTTGGKSEIFFLKHEDEHSFHALVKGKVRAGEKILLGEDSVTLEKALVDGNWLISSNTPTAILMERHGKLPLPPYIRRDASSEDDARYQTVYARYGGSVAAPTAGLHFTENILKNFADKGVETVQLTLHVGLGTFRPVKTERLSEHVMHREHYEISPEAADKINSLVASGKRLVAVGTTSVRTVESATDIKGRIQAGSGDTSLFIQPSYKFKAIKGMLTNFHLPKSTLFVLVSSFMGLDSCREAYKHAVAERYRFFSYGDAMLIL